MKIKLRSIKDDWQVSQDIPSPFESVRFLKSNYAPFSNPEHYASYINDAVKKGTPIHDVHQYDEQYNMPGFYTNAEIIDGALWLTFEPQKVGNCWVSLSKIDIWRNND